MPTKLLLEVEHTIRATPDTAFVSLGVETEAASAGEALAANAAAMNGVFAALRELDIAEFDLQTGGVGVCPNYAQQEGREPKIAGHRALNILEVTLRDPPRLGAIIDAAIGAGANRVHSVRFEALNADALLDQARREALAKAMARARLYAEAAGLEIARVAEIREGGRRPEYAMTRSAFTAGGATPVAAGEVGLTAKIEVVIELV